MTSVTPGADERTGYEYQFDAGVPLRPIPTGTNVLIEGSAVDGAGVLLSRMLTSGWTPGEAAVLVSTEGTTGSFGRRFDDEKNVGLVTCGPVPDDVVADGGIVASSVANPGDLTGLGIQFSKVADAVSVSGGSLRVGVESISTILMYATDPRAAFRFVHAFTGRVTTMDALGLFTVDPGVHDDRTLGMIRGPFDAIVQLRAGETGPELRVTGLPGQPEGWQPYRLEER